MANVLKMALVESILSLRAQRWSQWRIARELQIDRETVSKYLRQRLCGAKPANVPTGSDGSKPATLPDLPASDPKPGTNLPTGSIAAPVRESAGLAGSVLAPPGPQSLCEPHREIIVAKLQQDLSATRIWQDLVEAGAEVGYDSVRRFIQRLGKNRPLPFQRLESAPGEEAQVDFGTGAPIVTTAGKRRKTHVFRIVLSCSRKGYSEVTFT